MILQIEILCLSIVVYPVTTFAITEIVNTPYEKVQNSRPGTDIVGTTASELSCLFQSVGFVKKEDADKSAIAISKALANISFPSGTFNRTSLLHFMSQVVAESDHLRTDEQYGNLTFDKKGWAMIQVTGQNNYGDSIACMDRFANGRGYAVLAGTATAVGNKAHDRFSSALMSLCYWRSRIAMNPRFSAISQTKSDLASRQMTQIVNAGAIDKPVTNGERNLVERVSYFNRIKAADELNKCRP